MTAIYLLITYLPIYIYKSFYSDYICNRIQLYNFIISVLLCYELFKLNESSNVDRYYSHFNMRLKF